MRSLRDLEAGAQMDVPRDVGSNIKMLANDERYTPAWRFILDALCGVNRLSSAMPDELAAMSWRQGRRFVGLQLQAIATAPMDDEAEPEPPARTMTEKARRRALKSPTD